MTEDDLGLEEGEELARRTASLSPTWAAVVQRHRDEFDEVLSTILLDELAERCAAAVAAGDTTGLDEVGHLVRVLGELWSEGNETMRTAIATGFLEAVPHPDEPGREVVDLLPPTLRDELQRMEGWRPGG